MELRQLYMEFKKQTSMKQDHQVIPPDIAHDTFGLPKKSKKPKPLLDGVTTIEQFKNINDDGQKKQSILKLILQEFIKFIELGLCLQEVVKNDLFVQKPYFRQNSKKFFDAIKCNNLSKVDRMLLKDKYLIYDIDSVNNF